MAHAHAINHLFGVFRRAGAGSATWVSEANKPKAGGGVWGAASGGGGDISLCFCTHPVWMLNTRMATSATRRPPTKDDDCRGGKTTIAACPVEERRKNTGARRGVGWRSGGRCCFCLFGLWTPVHSTPPAPCQLPKPKNPLFLLPSLGPVVPRRMGHTGAVCFSLAPCAQAAWRAIFFYAMSRVPYRPAAFALFYSSPFSTRMSDKLYSVRAIAPFWISCSLLVTNILKVTSG